MSIHIQYFENCKSKTAKSFPMSIPSLETAIKEDKDIARKIEGLRAMAGKPKKERQEYKANNLPAVTFSGLFVGGHAIENFKSHSGLFCLDLDDFEAEKLEEIKSLVYADEYTFIAFVGPSGNGIKVVFRLDSHIISPQLHKEIYFELEAYALNKWGVKIDKTCKDVSRLCYLSHDEDLFLNYDSKAYPVGHINVGDQEAKEKAELEAKKAAKKSTTPPPTPPQANGQQTDAERLEETVMLLEVNRIDITEPYDNFVKVTMAFSSLGESGRSHFHRVAAISSKYDSTECDKRFDEALKNNKKTTIASFYHFANPLIEGYKIRKNTPKRITKVTNSTVKAQVAPTNAADGDAPDLTPDFIYPVYDKDGNKKDFKIDNIRLLEICKALGFLRLELAEGTVYCQRKGAILHVIQRKNIIDGVFDYIYTLDDEIDIERPISEEKVECYTVTRKLILSKMLSGQGTYLSEDKMLHLLDRKNSYDRLKHSQHAAWYFYSNGGVCVTKDGAQLIPYEDLPGYVWAGNAHKREFNTVDYSDFSFKKFVWNIANGRTITGDEAEARYTAIRTLIGYLLHGFFKTKLCAIAFTDSRISDRAEGRSGKSLICDAMGKILNAEASDNEKPNKFYVTINGKNFNHEDRFRYQTVTPQTQLLVINDMQANFNVENLFNDITEGVEAQQKTAMPITVFVKMALTINKTLKIEGGSAKHRLVQCELADYYSATYEPIHEFNEWFFRDWNAQQWQQFDCFMLDCVALYLERGLIIPSTINLEQRNLLDRTNDEFVLWWNDKVQTGEIKPGREFDKKELYEEFKKPFDEKDFKYLTSKLFTQWLRLASEVTEGFGIVTKDHERKSSGKNFIRFPSVATIEQTDKGTEENIIADSSEVVEEGHQEEFGF